MGLFDSFFGNDQRDDIRAADAQAQAALKKGRKQSIATREGALEQSLGFLEGGRDAQNVLLNALGVNGPDAQRDFANTLFTPGFEDELQFGVDQIDNSAASRGMLFSGDTLKAVADHGQRFKRGAFNDRVNQLFQLAGNAPAQSAAFAADTGDQIAATQFGSGQLNANRAVNFGNAMAASRSVPINNLLALGQTAAKVAGAFA